MTEGRAVGGIAAFEGSSSGYCIAVRAVDGAVAIEEFAAGHATELGRYTLVGRTVLDVGRLALPSGRLTLTAEDGATIAGTFSGKARLPGVPGLVAYEASGPITGGSGRFAGVTGEIRIEGAVDLATRDVREHVSGTFSWEEARP